MHLSRFEARMAKGQVIDKTIFLLSCIFRFSSFLNFKLVKPLLFYRVLMVIDDKNNFINARNYPELLLVKSTVKNSILTLRHNDMEPVYINLAEVPTL